MEREVVHECLLMENKKDRLEDSSLSKNFFFFLRAGPAASAAASLFHSHSNAGSEVCL